VMGFFESKYFFENLKNFQALRPISGSPFL